MSDKCLELTVSKEISNPDIEDPYWEMLETSGCKDTGTCYNQNHFKKFCKAMSENSSFKLEDIETPSVNWWTIRYPRKYPCKVQLFKHFEGGMLYLAIEYI